MVKVKDLVLHNNRMALVVRVLAAPAADGGDHVDLLYFLDETLKVYGKYDPRSNLMLTEIPPQRGDNVPVAEITHVG